MTTTLSSFMNLQNNIPGTMSTTPLWVNDCHKSDKKFKDWFVKHRPIVEFFNQPRIWNQWNNLLWYTGEILEFMNGVQVGSDFTGFKEKQRRTIPFWVNHMSDLADKRANDLASLKPNFEVSPPQDNVTEQTRTASRVVRPFLGHIRRYNNLDLLFDENERSNTLYGMSVITIDFNNKIGDRIYTKNSRGKIIKDEDGPKWEGEVEIKRTFPWYILPFPSRIAFNSPMAIQIVEIINVEEARKKYGDNTLQPDQRDNLYSFASPFGSDILPDEITIYRTIHIPTETMPDGAVIWSDYQGNVIKKEVKKYPYSHGGFPWEIHTDIWPEGKTFPYSILNNLKPLQWTYNLLGGMIKKSIFLTAHPKWMVPKGSINIQSLANAITVVQHKPGQKPELARYDVVGADTTNFREDVKTNMQKLAGSFGLSNGDIPPNTRSGIQISRLQNIEKMNRSYQMGKRNDLMKRVLLKGGSVAGDYYPKQSKEHLERTFGDETTENIGVLQGKKISDQADVIIQNGSGFSDDLAGRLDEVAFAREKLPGLIPPAQEADIIGIRSANKFYDVTTAALRMAEGENEAFNDGKKVDDPIIEQDHIQHWQTHVIDMQTPHHRMLPEKIRRRKEEHLGIHEMMMEQIANSPTGQIFKQKLVMLERYPLVYVPNNDLPAIQAEQAQEKALQMQQAQTQSAVDGAVTSLQSQAQGNAPEQSIVQ